MQMTNKKGLPWVGGSSQTTTIQRHNAPSLSPAIRPRTPAPALESIARRLSSLFGSRTGEGRQGSQDSSRGQWQAMGSPRAAQGQGQTQRRSPPQHEERNNNGQCDASRCRQQTVRPGQIRAGDRVQSVVVFVVNDVREKANEYATVHHSSVRRRVKLRHGGSGFSD
ncbi:hypothetical protein DM02DRAFT_724776 [Periconia macrospinosa]|uniref:Uncharacterized protein n=1 Tax=Periconia macrospinosa TaxID=97972 RepID=A0A2V1E611_9PLEO|nr:hypothetical protein DM02DRAFT_724776 [Periconia macrospinosa]